MKSKNVAQLLAASVAAGLLIRHVTRRSRLHAGQVAIITGASRGLGLALAHRFGQAGVKLVLVARSEEELEHAVLDLLEKRSVPSKDSLMTYACDLRDPSEPANIIQAAFAKFGRLDILINNAGIITVGPAENQPVQVYRDAMEADFFAALECTYAALPTFLRQRSGAIVNIASIGGKVAVPHLLPYVAAKFALTGFSEGLHAELRNKGVRVTTVCPGLMRTGGETHAQFRGQIAKEKAWFQLSARTPILSASPAHAAEDIFNAVDQGRAEFTITPQAWLAARFAGLAPETTQVLAAFINAHVLPDPSQSNYCASTSTSKRHRSA